jgi:hypothetical protein
MGFSGKFSRPSSGGSRFTKDDHLNHSIVFVEPELETITGGQYGDSDAARCSFVVCLDCSTVYADALIFGAALVPALTDGAEELVIGVLGRGEAKGGHSAPWLLFNPNDGDQARAEAYFEKHATRFPGSGRISLEISKPKRTEADGEPF